MLGIYERLEDEGVGATDAAGSGMVCDGVSSEPRVLPKTKPFMSFYGPAVYGRYRLPEPENADELLVLALGSSFLSRDAEPLPRHKFVSLFAPMNLRYGPTHSVAFLSRLLTRSLGASFPAAAALSAALLAELGSSTERPL